MEWTCSSLGFRCLSNLRLVPSLVALLWSAAPVAFAVVLLRRRIGRLGPSLYRNLVARTGPPAGGKIGRRRLYAPALQSAGSSGSSPAGDLPGHSSFPGRASLRSAPLGAA